LHKKKTRNLIIVIVIVLAVIVGGLVWYFYSKKGAEETRTGGDYEYTSVHSGHVKLPDRFDLSTLLEVHFVDVGQGDAIVLMLPDGKVMCIDLGSGTSLSNAVRDKYFNFLRDDVKIKAVDYLIITHPDSDHYNMGVKLLNDFDVKNIYYNEYAGKAGYDNFVAKAKEEEGAELFAVKTRGTFVVTGVGYSFTIYAIGSASNSNALSLITVFTYGTRKVIFTGDAEVSTESWFITQIPSNFDADVLKVGHHGSRSCTSQAFLSAIKVEFAVISCGVNNTYGHPHSETMKRLSDNGIVTYRTDVHGNVTLYIDGDGDMGFATQKSAPAENNPTKKDTKIIALVIQSIMFWEPKHRIIYERA